MFMIGILEEINLLLNVYVIGFLFFTNYLMVEYLPGWGSEQKGA